MFVTRPYEVILIAVILGLVGCAAAHGERAPSNVAAAIAYETEAGKGAFVPLGENIYADAATTEAERASLRASYTEAVRAVADALGPWQADVPRALFCKTDTCRRYLGGPSFRSRAIGAGGSAPGGRYVSPDRSSILVLRTDAGARGVTAHEMVHIEVAARLRKALVPEWFNEGVAALVSGAPNCEDRPAPAIDDLRLLESNAAWEAFTNVVPQQHAAYCQARAEVAAWVGAHGRERLVELLASLRDGASFYPAYGPLQNCVAKCEGPLGGDAPQRRLDASSSARLAGGATRITGHRGSAVRLSSAQDFLVTEPIAGLGVVDQPFSLELWVKPAARAGVLVHASVKPSGGDGWCAPFLGFDGAGRLVGQVLYALSEESFIVANGPELPLDAWSHVLMTWDAAKGVRLFVNDSLVATGAPASRTQEHYVAPGGRPVHLTYGSDQGSVCWRGGIPAGQFHGALDDLGVYNFAHDPEASHL